MSDHINRFSRIVAEGATRRRALSGLGALALGMTGILGAGQMTEARKNNNTCEQCRRQCKRNNKKKGKKNPNNCENKCRNRCNNN